MVADEAKFHIGDKVKFKPKSSKQYKIFGTTKEAIILEGEPGEVYGKENHNGKWVFKVRTGTKFKETVDVGGVHDKDLLLVEAAKVFIILNSV